MVSTMVSAQTGVRSVKACLAMGNDTNDTNIPLLEVSIGRVYRQWISGNGRVNLCSL